MTGRTDAIHDGFAPVCVQQGEGTYPTSLIQFFGSRAPERLFLFGNPEILQKELLGLFCSIKCPGSVILKTYDLARALRDAETAVIGGFHTPMEKEVLEILLRGTAPMIICPARSLERMRHSPSVEEGIRNGRVLMVSPFGPGHRRATVELAEQRNRLVAALASRVFVSHAAPGGKIEALCLEIIAMGKPLFTVDCADNANLLALGARAVKALDLFEP